jgi:CheY-like chemotaxis protein
MVAQKLLIIEDDEDNRMLIQFVLESETDWKIIAAANGIEGIAKAETERPDAILLDVIMPDLDGLTVCEVLKTNLFTCAIPVIFVTARVEAKMLDRLKSTLAVGIITKPFNINRFPSQITSMCGWKINKDEFLPN